MESGDFSDPKSGSTAATTTSSDTGETQKGQSARSRNAVFDGDSTGLVVRIGCAINVVVGLEELDQE